MATRERGIDMGFRGVGDIPLFFRLFGLRLIVASLFLLATPSYSFGQFRIYQQAPTNTVEMKQRRDKKFTNPVLEDKFEYTTNAMIDAERRRIRQKHNTFEILGDATASQISFTNWAAGGNKTLNTRGSLYILYKYDNEKLTVTNKFNSRLGFNIVDTSFFKNEDMFDFNSLGEWKINKHWSYSEIVIFRSQFLRGYKSINNKTLVSDFLSPATLELGLGFTYKPFKEPLKITVSPLAGKMLFVRNDELSNKKLNGIEKGKHFKAWVGPSMQATYSKRFYKDKLEVRSELNAFYDLALSPVVRFENTISYRPVKFLITKLYVLTIWDKEVMPPEMKNRVQLNYAITIGFSYAYKNK